MPDELSLAVVPSPVELPERVHEKGASLATPPTLNRAELADVVHGEIGLPRPNLALFAKLNSA